MKGSQCLTNRTERLTPLEKEVSLRVSGLKRACERVKYSGLNTLKGVKDQFTFSANSGVVQGGVAGRRRACGGEGKVGGESVSNKCFEK